MNNQYYRRPWPNRQNNMPNMNLPNMNNMPNPANPRYNVNDKHEHDPYCIPHNIPNALNLIKEAVAGEKEDAAYYEYLASIAPSDYDKNIILSIRDDEKRHYALLRRIYYELTCEHLPESKDVEIEKPESYCDGVKTAIMDETAVVKKYREILYAMMCRSHINIVTGIITDEQRHADLFNFLYSRVECYEQEPDYEQEKPEMIEPCPPQKPCPPPEPCPPQKPCPPSKPCPPAKPPEVKPPEEKMPEYTEPDKKYRSKSEEKEFFPMRHFKG